MNIDEALAFWNIVGKPADPTELQVGDAALLENVKLGTHRVIVVTKRMVDDDGNAQLTFRDAYPGEIGETPETVVIVE